MITKTRAKSKTPAKPQAPAPIPLAWHQPDQAPFRLSGFAWYAQDKVYRRLPVKPADPLPPGVESLANHTAGGQVSFITNSKALKLKAELAGAAGMDHMAATGACGFDVYVGPPGRQHFCGTTRFGLAQNAYEVFVFQHAQALLRNFTINFPLYQGVRSFKIGLDPEAQIKAPPPYALPRPVVVYGTSITQGGCASRPGMAYTNILSRRLNAEVINQGFSGSGQGEPEVARTIAAIPDPALLVIDCEANCGDGRLQERLPNFIGILRAAHRDTPILIVSRIRFAGDLVHKQAEASRKKLELFQRRLVERARRQVDRHIYFMSGLELLGDDETECTVDGVHATDLGFYRMAGALEPVIRKLLFR
jgi:lysophospholipase L1-like esterase